MKIKNNYKKIGSLISLTVLLIAGLMFLPAENSSGRQEISVLTGDSSVNVSVEIANSKSERRKGLMYRRELGLNEGMLFVFENEDSRSFWMKNTYIPLDIVFLDSDGVVLNVEEAYPQPNTSEEELKNYYSDGEAQYALELNSTFSEKYGLNTNDRVKFYNAVN